MHIYKIKKRMSSARWYVAVLTSIISICVSNSLQAQICQGSLGDPIVNISFGAGNNPGPALPSAATNYKYVDTDCPKDGFYAVRNKTENCFDSTWFTVTDHTGNANGYFMIVNASYDPGEFYLDTVSGLCSGSTYEFAAWLINIKKPVLCWGATKIINPNITFRIEKTDGTILQSYNSGDIVASDPPQWKQYGFFFTTPTGVNTVVLRMVNNAPGGCGNDIGLDDITFRPCGPQIQPSIQGSTQTMDTLCSGYAKQYVFNAQVSGGYNNPTYQWQQSIANGGWTDIAGATSTSYTADFNTNANPATYRFRLLAAEAGNMNAASCRVSSEPLVITAVEKEQVTASGTNQICEGQSIQLNAVGNQISWRGPADFTANGNSCTIQNAQLSNAGKYYAVAKKGSCEWKDSVSVQVNASPMVTVVSSVARICEGDSVLLSATGANTFEWFPSNHLSNPFNQHTYAKPDQSIQYAVKGTNGNGCSDTATVAIQVTSKPKAIAGPDKAIMNGATIALNGFANGDNIDYYWTPDYKISDVKDLNASVSPLKDTTYVLHVVSNDGCGSSTDSVKVTILKDFSIPNAFSPNGDGVNDVWQIAGLESYPMSRISIFSRNGVVVYESFGYKRSWDGRSKNGTELPIGTYYYVIDPGCGKNRITGNVTILR